MHCRRCPSAYLCNAFDTNIEDPLGKVLIKPCIRAGEKIQVNPANFILQCSQVYGTFYASYIKQLQAWLNTHWNSKVNVTPGRYNLTNMAYREVDSDMDYEYTKNHEWKDVESDD